MNFGRWMSRREVVVRGARRPCNCWVDSLLCFCFVCRHFHKAVSAVFSERSPTKAAAL